MEEPQCPPQGYEPGPSHFQTGWQLKAIRDELPNQQVENPREENQCCDLETRVCVGPFPGRLGYSLARVGPWGLGELEPTGGGGKGAQIMALEAGSAAQRGRQSTSGMEGALAAAHRIQVSPAETRPPDMVKIAQTLLIGNTPDSVDGATPPGGLCRTGALLCAGTAAGSGCRAQQWTVVSGKHRRVPTGHHGPQLPRPDCGLGSVSLGAPSD